MLKFIFLILFCLMLTTACAPVNHLQISEPDLQQSEWQSLTGQSASLQPGELNKRWWLEFEEPSLSAIIEQVLAANYAIRIAAKRLESVQQDARASAWGQTPRLSVEAGFSDEKRSLKRSDFLITQRNVETYNAGLAYSWELDIFGRVNKQAKLDKARYQGQQADLYALQSMLVASTVRTYIAYRSAQLRERSMQRQFKRQQQRHQLNLQLQALGRLTKTDTLESAAIENSLQAQLLVLQAESLRASYALRLLSGGSDIEAHLQTTVDALPSVPASVMLHSVSKVLQQRPDIVAAQYRLHSAVAAYQISHSGWWPRISLNGSVGYVATEFDDLGAKASEARIFNPRLEWSALNFVSLKAKIKSADRLAQVGLLKYEQVVSQALNELREAIQQFSLQEQAIQVAKLQSRGAIANHEIVGLRFERGLGNQFDVYTSKDVADQKISNLILQESELLLRLVDIYRAAGA